MEELKLLIGMVTDLPQMALWVLVGYLAYKLAVVGSIYGTIRFAIDKLHSYKIKQKELPAFNREVALEDTLNGLVISSDQTMRLLIAQLRRLAGKGTNINTPYIHTQSVAWLREAIDAKLEAEKESLQGS